MKYISILILIVLSCNHGFGQKRKQEYLLRWKVKDTTTYNVAFGEVNVKVNDKIMDIKDPKVQLLIEEIRKDVGVDLENYKLTSKIYPDSNEYYVHFYFNSIPVLKGIINEKGNLLSSVEKKSENFFKILYALPDQQIKLGDEWKSNLQIQKSFRGITFTDSSRIDKFIFDKIVKKNGDDIAIIKLELSEKFAGKFINENGKEEDATVQIFYNSENFFNMTKGKWNSIDGILVFDFDVGQRKKSIMKVGLIEK